MNFKNESIRTLQDLATEYPNYSLGELMFSCFQKIAVKNKTTVSVFLTLSDEDIYTEIEKTFKRLEENE